MINTLPDSKLFLQLFTEQLLLNSRKKTPEDKEKINIAKVKQLLADKEIQSIECTGPGKFLLIKRENEIDLSNIKLEEAEIRTIINYFVKKAGVDFTGGVFNASLGNLKINALESEFAGSRFILIRLPKMIK